MSEEKKIIELNDEDLEKVSGGAKYGLIAVDRGDVFIQKKLAYIVKSTMLFSGISEVPVLKIFNSDGVWLPKENTTLTFSNLGSMTFSPELSGTLNYLL